MPDPMLPDVLWDWAKTTGPAGFALIVWWLERKERLDIQKRYDALVERVTTVAENGTSAIKTVNELLLAGRRIPPGNGK